MIYAVTKQKFPVSFAFKTRIQSKVENVMQGIGHGCNDYYLTSKKPKYPETKVQILDKHGLKFVCKY